VFGKSHTGDSIEHSFHLQYFAKYSSQKKCTQKLNETVPINSAGQKKI